MSYEFYRARNFAKRLKKKENNVLIVFGGIHATIAPEECLSVADVVIRGEGEYVFLELIKRIEQLDKRIFKAIQKPGEAPIFSSNNPKTSYRREAA